MQDFSPGGLTWRGSGKPVVKKMRSAEMEYVYAITTICVVGVMWVL
jgi:hypothetical protein